MPSISTKRTNTSHTKLLNIKKHDAEQTCYLVKVTCIYLCCRWRSIYQRGQFGIPLTGLIVVKLLCHSHIRTWISIIKRRVFLCSRVWCERCWFVLLILMAFFTSIFLSFHCYYIGILSFFSENTRRTDLKHENILRL
jgi:hypothetical protein